MTVVTAELAMRTDRESLDRRFHDVAGRAEVIVMLHVVPSALAAERSAAHDDGNHQRQDRLNRARPRSKPARDCATPAHEEHENPRRHGNAQEESGDLDPLRDIEEESKNA